MTYFDKHGEHGHESSEDGTLTYCRQNQYCGSGTYFIIKFLEKVIYTEWRYNEYYCQSHGYYEFDSNETLVYYEYFVFLEIKQNDNSGDSPDRVLYLCEPQEEYLRSNQGNNIKKSEIIAILNCLEWYVINTLEDFNIHVGVRKHVYRYDGPEGPTESYEPYGKERLYTKMITKEIIDDEMIKRWKTQPLQHLYSGSRDKYYDIGWDERL